MAEFGVKYWAELRSRYKGVLWRAEIAERGFTGTAEEITAMFEKYQERGFFEIDMKYIQREKFMADIQSDLQLLKDIRTEWLGEEPQIQFDYKLDAFRKLLKKLRTEDPKRKIIVFTEFADTANYLGTALENDNLGIFKYTSKEASSTNKDAIRANFDAGLKPQYQRDDMFKPVVGIPAFSLKFQAFILKFSGRIFPSSDHFFLPLQPIKCAIQIIMAGSGSIINSMRLTCLGKSNGQPLALSWKGALSCIPYFIGNQANYLFENLDMCENCVNTHTHTHILTGVRRALIYSFLRRSTRAETLFSGVFCPFPYSYLFFHP